MLMTEIEISMLDKFYEAIDEMIVKARDRAKNSVLLADKIVHLKLVGEYERARSNFRLARFKIEDAMDEVIFDRMNPKEAHTI